MNRTEEAEKKAKEKIIAILEEFEKNPYMGFESLDDAIDQCKITSQAEVLARLINRENIFISGLAGTGKTTVINQFVDFIRAEYNDEFDIAITASTGIAATLIKGQTIHSWSGIGISNEPFDPKTTPLHRIKNLKSVDVLIIDEISMLPAYVFTKIDKMLKYVRKNDKPFGGVQLVVIGDFLQLPPIPSKDTNIDTRYCIQTPEWKDANFSYCFLDKSYRTTDEKLKKILMEISENNISEESKKNVMSRIGAARNPNNVYATLFTTNKNVDAFNDEKMMQNPNPEVKISSYESGPQSYCEKIYKNSKVDKQKVFKKDAIVIATKNFYAYNIDERKEVYIANGSIGIIDDFVKKDDTKNMINIFNDGVYVNFNGIGECRVGFMPYEYTEDQEITIMDKNNKPIKKKYPVVKATVYQVPLKLGYAITVHKSQGQTFNGVEVDLSKCFQDGLGYVALSRVRNLDDLIITGFNEKAYKISPLSYRISKYVKEQAIKNRLDFIKEKEEYNDLLTNNLYRYLKWPSKDE